MQLETHTLNLYSQVAISQFSLDPRCGQNGLGVQAWPEWSGGAGMARRVWGCRHGQNGLGVQAWPEGSGGAGMARMVWNPDSSQFTLGKFPVITS